MHSTQESSSEIPVLPLSGALPFPRSYPLHIFEPRYLAMVDDCLKTDARLIGIIQPINKTETSQHLHTIGCAGRVSSFSEAGDGRYTVTLKGTSRFKVIKEWHNNKPCIRRTVDWTPFKNDYLSQYKEDHNFQHTNFLALLKDYLEMMNIKIDLEDFEQAGLKTLINAISMICPFSPEDKQALLETPSLMVKYETLVTLIEFAILSTPENKTMQ